MTLAHILGFPRIGAQRELKTALEAHWQGRLDETGLRAVGAQLRQEHWQQQRDAGLDLVCVGDLPGTTTCTTPPRCSRRRDAVWAAPVDRPRRLLCDGAWH